MSQGPLAVRTIIVAGGGIVGWSTAAALKRRIPALAVTVLPVPSPADALADRIGTTLPSILEFHNDIGISEGDVIGRIGCNFRLGTAFEGWTDGDDYVHAYDDYGRPLGTTSFHLHWVRARQAGRVAPFDSHSPAAAMGRAGRFVHPQGEPGSPLAGFGYGLRIDPERYRQMMRAYALHVGVTEGPGTIEGVAVRGEDGHIAGVQVGDGIEISADLYVDCTGPAALLRGQLDDGWEDWSEYLLADRVLFADSLQQAEPPSLDRAVALAAGWRWESAGPQTTSHGLVYTSAEYSDSKRGARAAIVRLGDGGRSAGGAAAGPASRSVAAQLRRDRRCGGGDRAARMDQSPSRPLDDRPARRQDARPRFLGGRAVGL